MTSGASSSHANTETLRGVLRRVWGYDEFRPLQQEAMRCVVEGRDSVVVLPTGGGKSLCFQAPAVAMPGLAVVISPLISLMKDQVDTLTDCGVAAACVHSALEQDERRRVADQIRAGRLKLLYMSPERLMSDRTLDFLQHAAISFFAIDEAHCISDWGHDFRPEYRMLSRLKEIFPGVAAHAYTATATERVRHDIARELRLERHETLVGSFDRPNLTYRVQRRTDLARQVLDVVERQADNSGIIYCIRRADVDALCQTLVSRGHAALPYHAGLSDEDRRQNQEAFIKDRAKIVVATVAFGMGIDKPDVRYVIHAAAPKSLESYQQESGRAGRDGLEAECWLFHSSGDFQSWRRMQQSLEPRALEVAMHVLAGIESFACAATCRHRSILAYFGEPYKQENCGACDVCLDEVDVLDDALVVGRKIVSCVARLNESFGGDYTAQVLAGSREKRILDNGHDRLSTWGLLAEHDKRHVRGWIEELVAQGFLAKQGEYNTLGITDAGRELLRGQASPRLQKPAATRPRRQSRAADDSWEGVDRGLFEALRKLRRQKADERGVPPFVVFGDATLRDLARRRPSSMESLLEVHGIGEKKRAEYGQLFLAEIADWRRRQGVPQDTPPSSAHTRAAPRRAATREADEEAATPRREEPRSAAKQAAFELFAERRTIEEVCAATGRARSTIFGYLLEHIEREQLFDASAWIDRATFERVRELVESRRHDRLKTIHEALNGEVDYDTIRVALACLKNA